MSIRKLFNHRIFTRNISFTVVIVLVLCMVQQLPSLQLLYIHGQITDPTTVQVGDEICFEGYVMDYYCIDRGTLLDNPNVVTLEGPDQHSVHCLIEVEECYTSPFELLGDPVDNNEEEDGSNSNSGSGSNNSGNGSSNSGSGGGGGGYRALSNDKAMYTRVYRVDDTGRDLLIELARSHGDCRTCNGDSESDSTPLVSNGFRAEVYGTVIALSSNDNGYVPIQIQVSKAARSNGQAIVCGMNNTRLEPTKAPTGSELDLNQKDASSNNNKVGIKIVSALIVIMSLSLLLISLYSTLGNVSLSK